MHGITRERHGRQAGFTLVELLVALALMALMAGMAWRVLAGMQTAMEVNRQHADAVLTLEAGLGQWSADLDALVALPQTRTLEWDGRALRLTRRLPGDEGAVVVCWTRAERDGVAQWLRWQSAPVATREAWLTAWAAANAWVQGADTSTRTREVRITAMPQWQLFYYRTGAWSNPLSSAGSSPGGEANASLPEGIRLVLTLPAAHALPGTLVRDWARKHSAGAMP